MSEELQNIFILIGTDMSRSEVIDYLICEGYEHNFYFGDDYGELTEDDWKKDIKTCSELWMFGEPITGFGNPAFINQRTFAEENNVDVWHMG